MSDESVPVVAVLGPADLAVTALVSALHAGGLAAVRIGPVEHLRDGSGLPRRGPGVLVVDIDVPNATVVIPGATSLGWTVLAVGSESEQELAATAIVAGAVGWIPKSASIDALVEAVSAAAAGRLSMTADVRAAWLELHRHANAAVLARLQQLEQLSPREREVLWHLAEGRRVAEIRELLFLSVATVRTHIRSILVKLGVNSQEQAAAIFRETASILSRTMVTRGRDPASPAD